MADPKGFLKFKREESEYRPVCERVKDYSNVVIMRPDSKNTEQAQRCMDCGTPFCHWACPVSNYIPEWNSLIFQGRWKKAFQLLQATNNFPEFTGRICPALCEFSCVLGVNDDPVTIRENELAVIEHAFREGYVKPLKITKRSGKSVAVVGSGPAGLACADQLNKAGHKVTVFEKDDKVGGILRYGIPDFKLEKTVIDRRVALMKKEGVSFVTRANIGYEKSLDTIKKDFDAVCLACGSRIPRDLKIPGRDMNGIYFAMDYLMQSNKRQAGVKFADKDLIDARGKKVLVIGGGDTGADCVGTANRQGASCVVQIEVMPKPAECRTDAHPWPKYPLILKTSSSHKEGAQRDWAVLTKEFAGDNGAVKKVSCVRVEFVSEKGAACPVMREMPGSAFEIEADIVLLAIGFVHPDHGGPVSGLGLSLDKRGNVLTDDKFSTSSPGVFAAGDMRRGQSLVVWAIQEGRQAARNIDVFLTGSSNLPIL